MSHVMDQMLIVMRMDFNKLSWNYFIWCYPYVIMLLRSQFSKLLKGAKDMMHKGKKAMKGKKKKKTMKGKKKY